MHRTGPNNACASRRALAAVTASVVAARLMFVFVLLCTLVMWSCGDPTAVAVGGVYSIRNSDGLYGVIKIVLLKEARIGVCIYEKSYPRRVDRSVIPELSVLKEAGYVYYTEINETKFPRWYPQLIAVEPVTEEELEGYFAWLAGGMPF